jgi:hypothetical protein
MKKLLGIIVIGWVVQLSGADSIGEQIEKIQNAPPQERVEMMNRLKLQIAQMNEAEREEALNALQHKGSHKRIQFRHQKMNDGSGGQMRQRMNSQTGGVNRQQGRQ